MTNLATAIRILLIGAATFSAAVAYTFWLQLQTASSDLKVAQEQVVMLSDARERDALAQITLLGQFAEEQERYTKVIQDLSEVNDAASKDYLNTPVPEPIRGLFD